MFVIVVNIIVVACIVTESVVFKERGRGPTLFCLIMRTVFDWKGPLSSYLSSFIR